MKPSNLSVVVPCHNEQEALPTSFNTLFTLLKKWSKKELIGDYQIVVVNNGSTDNTLKVAVELKEKYHKVKIIDLRSNYGYQSSITAGLYNSDFEMVISIDADLQDDPAKMEEMIHYYYQGFEMVLGIRSSRQKDRFFKRISANAYYKVLKLLKVKSEPNHGDFRLLSKRLIEELKQYKEKNRFLRALIFEIESNYACIYYERNERKFGETKFNLSQLIKLSIDGISSFTANPIYIIFYFGLITLILSSVMSLILIANYLLNKIPIQGWTSLILFILFFGSIQLISISIVGVYISKIYMESKSRPLYHIRKIY